ncbi:MAG TPA: FAD-linked oxidase C-terminal domain-containing protein [Candidatus Baltobacteraceae bacterium]|nr:FAD-linked oxidase C-terminal domain-containing protein [Candidatus Baltobacteraceae bacterium]
MTATASAREPVLAKRLEARLRASVAGDVFTDRTTRGLYATDASIYQMMPLGVVIPRNAADVEATIAIAREEGVPVTARGGGTSQCGQTVNHGIIVDVSPHLREIVELDVERRRVRVQPGIVLDALNRALKPQGLFFPVDPSTASRCTIGGMAANNSSGARSIRYGIMADNVAGIDAVLADGTRAYFGPVGTQATGFETPRYRELVERVRRIAAREADEIAARIPKVQRHVGGYAVQTVAPSGDFNLAKLLVGSEGTLAFFTAIDLVLQPIPKARALGVCHFPSFGDAMRSTEALVGLGPVAVELVDRTMIELSRDIAAFAPIMAKYVRGEPGSLLLVEFGGDEPAPLAAKLDDLDGLMASLGFPTAVMKLTDPAQQAEMWEVRSQGLNIMTSMRGDAKPVSIVEDCAVPLKHLAEYTDGLNEIFARHGTSGTFYAHASVGCLHVRPVLNVKSDDDVRKLREIAEETFALVRRFDGAHSGEHGDGIVRSEFHEEMFGPRIVGAFRDIKAAFDPGNVLNPGKIVDAPRMDDRTNFRYGAGYAHVPVPTRLDWSEWGDFAAATEMCNNNGACRKAHGGAMCPSYRVTDDEHHVTRGRANALRLALSGQLGPDALASDELYGVLDLCVSCKACKRECPTGVDMARMKIEFLAHYRKAHGTPLRNRIVAALPEIAHRLGPFRRLANLRDAIPGIAKLTERASGFTAQRPLPRWHAKPFRDPRTPSPRTPNGEVVLFVDTFNRWFEPDVARAAVRVLQAAGYAPIFPVAAAGARPLCCGRTYLGAGMADEAHAEMERTISALLPFADRGVPIVGLEPSCLLTLRDETLAMLGTKPARTLAKQALLFEEFVARELDAGLWSPPLRALDARAVVHGHCHQKAFGAMPAVMRALGAIPGLRASQIESSCCGMAGMFGYEREHYEVSMKMAERDLLPAVRDTGIDTLVVADGMSCKHQIEHGAAIRPLHVAEVFAQALV